MLFPSTSTFCDISTEATRGRRRECAIQLTVIFPLNAIFAFFSQCNDLSCRDGHYFCERTKIFFKQIKFFVNDDGSFRKINKWWTNKLGRLKKSKVFEKRTKNTKINHLKSLTAVSILWISQNVNKRFLNR